VSVLRDIRDKLVELLEGTAVSGVRMPAAGLFAVVGDDHEVQQAEAADASPRPVYVEAGYAVSDPTLPSDVSGDYHWEARAIPVWVAYAYNPDDDTNERDGYMDDDEMAIKRVLSDPLNCALVAGWGKSTVDVTRQNDQRDPDGVVAVKWLLATVQVAYREDWS
jgi:hypothetical protein